MILAVGRLERAIARAERAAQSQSAAPKAPAADADLQQRHDRLKSETRQAISAIDKLLESEAR